MILLQGQDGNGRSLSRQRYLVMVFAGLLMTSAASAQPPAGSMQSNPQSRDENGERLGARKSALTGSITYNSDANAVIDGGNRTGPAYLQRIGFIGDADLNQLIGWRGATMHASVHAISGNGLSALRVGNILTVSGLEAEPAFRLFNLWVEQKLGKRVTLRVGQFTAGQEFAISNTANLFVNSTFGWPGSFATDLPSGGPAYPLAAPGVRLAASVSDRLSVRVATFSGDPAGQGTGDPQRRDLHGFNGFRLKGSPFAIAEVNRNAGGTDPAWTIALGGWVHFDAFDDLQFDAQGRSLASPRSTGEPLRHSGDRAAYLIVDGRLWRSTTRSVRAFVRATASPGDRNPIDLYIDGGLTLKGLFKGRSDDTVGIGLALARLSPALRSFIRESADVAGQPTDVPRYEAVLEASYQFKVRPSFYLQPNVQFIVHPSAALLSGDGGTMSATPNAIVVGLRTSLSL